MINMNNYLKKFTLFALIFILLSAGCGGREKEENEFERTKIRTGQEGIEGVILEPSDLASCIAAYGTKFLYMVMGEKTTEFYIYDFTANKDYKIADIPDFALSGRSNIFIGDTLYFYLTTRMEKNQLYSVNFTTNKMKLISENDYAQKLILVAKQNDCVVALQGDERKNGQLDNFLEVISKKGRIKQKISLNDRPHTVIALDSDNDYLYTIEQDEQNIYYAKYDSTFTCIETTDITDIFKGNEITKSVGMLYAFGKYFSIMDFSGNMAICEVSDSGAEILLSGQDLDYAARYSDSDMYEYFYKRQTNDLYRLNLKTGDIRQQNYDLDNENKVICCVLAYKDSLFIVKEKPFDENIDQNDNREDVYFLSVGNVD